MGLKIPYHHQKNCYFCGPTSLKMVLERLGVKRTEDKIAGLAGTNEEVGTTHHGMIDACKRLGFSCFVHEKSSLRNVMSFLKIGLPVIVNWTDYKSDTGHYSVVSEVRKGNIIFCDPWYGPGYAVQRDTFEEYWNDSLRKGYHWIMVVLPRNANISQEIKIGVNKRDILIMSGRIYRA